MFLDTLELRDRLGAIKPFTRKSFNANGSSYVDLTSPAGVAPRALTIGHTTSGKGAELMSRHLVAVKTSGLDVAGVTRTGGINITFNQPVGGVTDNMMLDAFSYAVWSMSSGITAAGIVDQLLALYLLKGIS